MPPAPPRLFIIDWGQCGGPTPPARQRQLATLVLALAESDPDGTDDAAHARVASAMRELGVVKRGARDDLLESKMARGMFDSAGDLGPISGPDSGLADGGIETLPKDLFLVMRVTQMLRGLGSAAEKAGAPPVGSLARAWSPMARRALRRRSFPGDATLGTTAA